MTTADWECELCKEPVSKYVLPVETWQIAEGVSIFIIWNGKK